MSRFIAVLIGAALPVFATAGSGDALVAAARNQVGVTTRYDGAYQRIGYPGGDVPIERGVCTDVVVRAYRSIGIDLQPDAALIRDELMASACRPCFLNI